MKEKKSSILNVTRVANAARQNMAGIFTSWWQCSNRGCNCSTNPSERLTLLSVVGAPLRAPLKPPRVLLFPCCSRSFRGALNWALRGGSVSRKVLLLIAVENPQWRTQRKLFEILLIHTEIRLYLLFSNWFGSKRTSVSSQIKYKYNLIPFELTRFRKVFSVCTHREIFSESR